MAWFVDGTEEMWSTRWWHTARAAGGACRRTSARLRLRPEVGLLQLCSTRNDPYLATYRHHRKCGREELVLAAVPAEGRVTWPPNPCAAVTAGERASSRVGLPSQWPGSCCLRAARRTERPISHKAPASSFQPARRPAFRGEVSPSSPLPTQSQKTATPSPCPVLARSFPSPPHSPSRRVAAGRSSTRPRPIGASEHFRR